MTIGTSTFNLEEKGGASSLEDGEEGAECRLEGGDPRRKVLVFGGMPPGASPKTHIAAGPWCFAGREDIFPDWHKNFRFAPESMTTPEELELAAGRSLTLAREMLMPVAEAICGGRKGGMPDLPPEFWETFLTPWCVGMSVLVVLRMASLRAMIAALGECDLTVPLLPERCAFTFKTESDFTFGGALGHNYNHWLFSRLLEPCLPNRWRADYLSETREAYAPSGDGFWSELGKKAARRLVLALPFPKPKGFTLRQSLKFSLALMRNKNQEDLSRSLSDFAGPEPDLPGDVLPLFMASLPESLRKARFPGRIDRDSMKKLRIANISAYEDAGYRMRLAKWRARGHKLAYIQHGGNYGQVRSSAVVSAVEYAQHAFITWGWRRQSPQKGNFIPLPHGQPAQMRNSHQAVSDKLLMVGMEMTLFPYRVDSRPNPMQYVNYREEKKHFLDALAPEIKDKVSYRPYFPVPGTLEDGAWVTERFPQAKICSGPLDPHMLGCRLLVLDHHGTTLQLAMAANVPQVLFWDRQALCLCPEAEILLDCLASAAIWHPDGASAAKHINSIWDDVHGWWNSIPVQTARGHWVRLFSRTVDTPIDAEWIKSLKTI